MESVLFQKTKKRPQLIGPNTCSWKQLGLRVARIELRMQALSLRIRGLGGLGFAFFAVGVWGSVLGLQYFQNSGPTNRIAPTWSLFEAKNTYGILFNRACDLTRGSL